MTATEELGATIMVTAVVVGLILMFALAFCKSLEENGPVPTLIGTFLGFFALGAILFLCGRFL